MKFISPIMIFRMLLTITWQNWSEVHASTNSYFLVLTPFSGVISGDLERPWVTAKYTVTWSSARSLCNNWASCFSTLWKKVLQNISSFEQTVFMFCKLKERMHMHQNACIICTRQQHRELSSMHLYSLLKSQAAQQKKSIGKSKIRSPLKS